MPGALGSNVDFGEMAPAPGDISTEAKLEAVSHTLLESEGEAAADIATHNSAVTAHGQVAGVFPVTKGGTGAGTAPLARAALAVPRTLLVTDNPNAGAGTAGTAGDEATDTAHGVAYRNLDGTATGWGALN